MLLLFIVALEIFSGLFFTHGLMMQPLSWKKRTVGGKDTTIEEFPYLVALERSSQHVCCGAIISPYHILTAGHCFDNNKDPSAFRVRLGSSLGEEGGILHEVKNFSVHHSYTISDGTDLAVLQLKNPIELDISKQAITMFEFGEKSEPGSVAIIAGWGTYGTWIKPHQLRSIKLNVDDKETCDDSWAGNSYLLPEGQICAFVIEGSKSICDGDSGTPLVIKGRLAGIASFGYQNCTSWPKPNVFTEVSHYRKWIDETVKALHS